MEQIVIGHTEHNQLKIELKTRHSLDENSLTAHAIRVDVSDGNQWRGRAGHAAHPVLTSTRRSLSLNEDISTNRAKTRSHGHMPAN